MKKISISMLLCIMFICVGCPDKSVYDHQYITFVNKSDEKISCQFRYGRIEEKDTSLCVVYWDNPLLRIDSSSYGLMECRDIERNGSWETQLNTEAFVQILVMNDSVFQHYSHLFEYNDYSSYNDSIQKYVPILHCYQLTLEDLQCMNWMVVYPPDSTYNS